MTRRATTTAVPRISLLQDALVVTRMEAAEASPPPPVRPTAPLTSWTAYCKSVLGTMTMAEASTAWSSLDDAAREPFIALARESKTEYDAQKKLLSDFEAAADSRQPARGRKRSKPGCVNNAPARLS